jgi:tetratricopeptide (TPR) repeat protein
VSDKRTNDETDKKAETQDPAQADFDKGKELRGAGDLVGAASYFHNALVDFEERGNDRGVANASDQLGDLCVARNEHAKGLDHYLRAYGICDRENDMFSLVALQKKMAAARKSLKQYDAAVKSYLEVIDIYGEHKNPAGTVAAMEDLAALYLEMGRAPKAADAYRTIASIHNNFSHSLQEQEFLARAAEVEKQKD